MTIKKTNKWGDPYENEPDCKCTPQAPDEMFFGGAKQAGVKHVGLYCHCKKCSGRIWYERNL